MPRAIINESNSSVDDVALYKTLSKRDRGAYTQLYRRCKKQGKECPPLKEWCLKRKKDLEFHAARKAMSSVLDMDINNENDMKKFQESSFKLKRKYYDYVRNRKMYGSCLKLSFTEYLTKINTDNLNRAADVKDYVKKMEKKYNVRFGLLILKRKVSIIRIFLSAIGNTQSDIKAFLADDLFNQRRYIVNARCMLQRNHKIRGYISYCERVELKAKENFFHRTRYMVLQEQKKQFLHKIEMKNKDEIDIKQCNTLLKMGRNNNGVMNTLNAKFGRAFVIKTIRKFEYLLRKNISVEKAMDYLSAFDSEARI